MGTILSCKKNSSRKKNEKSSRKRNKKIEQNRLSEQEMTEANELYKVVFDPDGFSIHDLSLYLEIGSKPSLIADNVSKKNKGILKKENIKVEFKPAPIQLQNDSLNQFDVTKNINYEKPFKIIEIIDYIDDLYSSLLDPDRNAPIQRLLDKEKEKKEQK